ncbi:hypothetical protein H5J25_04530 [Sphingomonas aliaeris]|uniref:Uncharacterized protein n=1 Tax=Sphingomonas aliaeris TaxID=2759526 RepID=A0A974S4V6_9SPHN|nr:hypothetical protein [Sphingomonas aliaeris]QQV78012.1 hypothetical protein H5J25_04530 [Sphingomonas aliaeris]
MQDFQRPDDQTVAEPFEGLAADASARLNRLAETVRARRPKSVGSLDFELGWLAEPAKLSEIDRELKAWVKGKSRFVYRFKALEPDSYVKLTEAFDGKPLKTGDKDLRYSRMNAPASPRALYVGSSNGRFADRISCHLGRLAAAGTYAMKLAQWATAVPATMRFDYWSYAKDIDQIELEALEQELWDACTPLLGKRSGK